MRRPGQPLQLRRPPNHLASRPQKKKSRKALRAASNEALNEARGVASRPKVLERKQGLRNATLAVTFSLDRRKVDVRELSFLLAAGGLSTGLLDKEMSATRWNLEKLQRAVDYSTSVIAAFTRDHLKDDYMPQRLAPSPAQSSLFTALADQTGGGFSDWWDDQQTRFLGPAKLVGFARTTSDCSLVGAVHDIAVAPCARGQGIGKKLVKVAVRELTKRGIDDIAILSNSDLRPFFEDCGFGPDQMESTFMFYTSSRIPPSLQYPYPVKRPAELFQLQRTHHNHYLE
ncbi:hypothetical protein KFL_000280340 [Klebsormidium nitens]|uniref:N-acetyltransferase domain-containing protein n=1 Tax=Klebsormidium nitens TaxID=105231 RepID=A0A1Y1HQ51_KLENI|nr:hypothetical protein KFL_000280340 [Klebsormidium nitens]|eukprot:GAQ79329.1 hypothetical protein KFL_000280340 [Klebsormidium nitens]